MPHLGVAQHDYSKHKMTLAELKIGQSATITNVGGEGSLRQHFLDMGVLPGVPVTLVKYAPMGDPMELRIHGYELTLRRADARKIEVSKAESFSNGKAKTENNLSLFRFTIPVSQSPSILVLEKVVIIMRNRRRQKGATPQQTRLTRTVNSPLLWWATRIVARQHYSTN